MEGRFHGWDPVVVGGRYFGGMTFGSLRNIITSPRFIGEDDPCSLAFTEISSVFF